jgi:IS30 family transposase
MIIYFAHPYSSLEKGTNENTNSLIRSHLPKGTDFNQIHEKLLIENHKKLNNRPHKIISFKTPKEIIQSGLNFVA